LLFRVADIVVSPHISHGDATFLYQSIYKYFDQPVDRVSPPFFVESSQ
jgi:hypothetical protein